MRVLNWVQTKLHGAHCSRRKSEFSADSYRSVADISAVPCRNDELHDGWPTEVLSIGTFGMGEGQSDELKKLQEELALLMRARGVTTTEYKDKRRPHLTLKRSLNEGIAKQRPSFKKLWASTFSFQPRSSFRETMPTELTVTKIPRPLGYKGTHLHPDNSALEVVVKKDNMPNMPGRADAMGEERRSKWITTDSEYIVLEI